MSKKVTKPPTNLTLVEQPPVFKKSPLALAIDNEFNPITEVIDTPQQDWSDLNTLYEKCAEAIVGVGGTISEVLKQPKFIENVSNVNELNIMINGLKNDLESFTNDLIKIKAKHSNKFGLIESEDDFILSINVFEDYVNFNTRFTTITTPTIINIVEKVTIAVNKAQAQESVKEPIAELVQEDLVAVSIN